MTNDLPSGDVRLSEADATARSDSPLETAHVRNGEHDGDPMSRLDVQPAGETGGQLGTWRWLVFTDTVMWSDEVYRALGLDPDTAAPGYLEMKKMFTPESWVRLARAAEHGAITGAPYRTAATLVLPDGSRRRVLVQGGVGERGRDGRVFELRGVIFGLREAGQDIPERKTTPEQQLARSEALYRSEARYRSLVRAASEVVWTAAPDGSQEEANAEWRAFTGQTALGQTARQMRGYRWADAIHPEDRERTVEVWQRAVERGSRFQIEHRLRRHDGVYRWMRACAVPSRDAAGRILEWVGMHTDITEQVETGAALREREHRFHELAETLPELIWVTAPDGWSEYVNERFVQYTGIPASQLSGEARTGIIHPEDREQVMTRWARSVETGEPYVNTLRLRRHDGVYRTFLARSMPIRNAEGKIERWVGNATDVHDQRLAEDALRRTEKLAATGRLAASIAHEINNPLAAVMNSLYLALQMEMSEQARIYLLTAEQELARVAQVTTQTLRFHRQATAAAAADLSEIMESAIALYASRFRSQGIAVEREYSSRERLLCYGDELRQVFANLLANSLDATRRGGRVVTRIRDSHDWKGLGSELESEWSSERRGVRVTLADTGHGIAPEVRRQMFEPFVSTKQDTGTGLGLWVSDGIVRKHGGRIATRTRTQPPSGTVLMLFLPVAPVDAAFPGDAVA